MSPPTSQLAKFTMRPSRWMLFLRTFFPYQAYRFVRVNLRMVMMIWKSHG